jgi:hypothetical protein
MSLTKPANKHLSPVIGRYRFFLSQSTSIIFS